MKMIFDKENIVIENKNDSDFNITIEDNSILNKLDQENLLKSKINEYFLLSNIYQNYDERHNLFWEEIDKIKMEMFSIKSEINNIHDEISHLYHEESPEYSELIKLKLKEKNKNGKSKDSPPIIISQSTAPQLNQTKKPTTPVSKIPTKFHKEIPKKTVKSTDASKRDMFKDSINKVEKMIKNIHNLPLRSPNNLNVVKTVEVDASKEITKENVFKLPLNPNGHKKIITIPKMRDLSPQITKKSPKAISRNVIETKSPKAKPNLKSQLINKPDSTKNILIKLDEDLNPPLEINLHVESHTPMKTQSEILIQNFKIDSQINNSEMKNDVQITPN